MIRPIQAAHLRALLLAGAAVLAGAECLAQIIPPERRRAAIELLSKLQPADNSEFFAKLENARHPFTNHGRPEAPGSNEPAGPSQKDLEEALASSLQISGIIGLGDARRVFINRRPVAPGETFRARINQREETIRLIAIGNRVITVEFNGMTFQLPTR
jgi:hypothetical protein